MATPRPIRSRRGIGKRSFRSTKERTPPPVEPQQPVQPPDPPPAEPPPSPSPPPVVPSVRPPDISNEPLSSTLAPPMGASRRHIVIWLASTVTAFAAGVFVSQSFDAPPAPAATETAQPAPPPPEPKKPPPAPKPKPSATAPPLAPGYGHLVAESSVQGSGVYVFGELAGPPNQPLPVKCDRLAFVRLGTVPMRHWYTPGRTVEVRCGEVTRITLEPVPGSR
jgi:hypothetical protein